MVNAIFWGIYPPSEESPHSLIMKSLKIEYKPTKLVHLVIGTIFYILGALVAQQESLKNFLIKIIYILLIIAKENFQQQ